jgi:hypothetical protein
MGVDLRAMGALDQHLEKKIVWLTIQGLIFKLV